MIAVREIKRYLGLKCQSIEKRNSCKKILYIYIKLSECGLGI